MNELREKQQNRMINPIQFVHVDSEGNLEDSDGEADPVYIVLSKENAIVTLFEESVKELWMKQNGSHLA